MGMFRVAVVMGLAMGLTACTTPYQRASAIDGSGYTDTILDQERAVIIYSSTRTDRSTAVVNGAMLRAAELAKERGFDGFVVLSDSLEERDSFLNLGSTSADPRGSGLSSGIPAFLSRADFRLSVRFVDLKKEKPANAFVVDQVIADFRAKFR